MTIQQLIEDYESRAKESEAAKANSIPGHHFYLLEESKSNLYREFVSALQGINKNCPCDCMNREDNLNPGF